MIEGLEPYPNMKDSGVPWLGRVPEHWETERAKWLFRKMSRPVRDTDEVITCFRDGAVTLRRNRRTRGFTEALKEIGYQGIRKGDLVIHAMDAFAGAIGVADSDGKGTPVYSVCEPKPAADSHYFAYAVREMARRQWIQALARGIRERSSDFRFEGFGAQPVPLPPLLEQTAIVQFLTHADRRIRRLIRSKQKLITLLEEQKQAIIHRAVTRGLEPNARLKDSEVEWLGDIPQHWGVMRCRYLFREVDTRSRDGSELHLSMSQRLGLVPSDLVDNRTLVSESYAGGKLCEIGDLVLNRLKAHLGVFSVARHAGVISPDYTVLRPLDAVGVEYFEQVLRSPACRRELRIRAKGIVEGFWRLYTDDFYDIKLPVPPSTERLAIIDHFTALTSSVTKAADDAQREINLLKEFRTRLISNVVTGKLDVREAATRLPADDLEGDNPLDDTDTDGEKEDDSSVESGVEDGDGG